MIEKKTLCYGNFLLLLVFQREPDTDPKELQQINFTGKPHKGDGSRIFFS